MDCHAGVLPCEAGPLRGRQLDAPFGSEFSDPGEGPGHSKRSRTTQQARVILIGDRKFVLVGAGHLVPLASLDDGATQRADSPAAAPDAPRDPAKSRDEQPTFLSAPARPPASPELPQLDRQPSTAPPMPQNPFCPQLSSRQQSRDFCDPGSSSSCVQRPTGPPAAMAGAPASVVVISRKALIRAAAGGNGGAAAVAAALAAAQCSHDSPAPPGSPAPAAPPPSSSSPAAARAPPALEEPVPKRRRPTPIEVGEEAAEAPESPAARTPELERPPQAAPEAPAAPAASGGSGKQRRSRTTSKGSRPNSLSPQPAAFAEAAAVAAAAIIARRAQESGAAPLPAQRPASPRCAPAASAFSPVPPSSSPGSKQRLQRSPTPEPAGAGAGARLSIEELQRAQTLLEGCLQRYMAPEEAAEHLCAAHRVDPSLTALLWSKLEAQNGPFFRTYRLWLRIKAQIGAFNELCGRLISAAERAAAARAARAAASMSGAARPDSPASPDTPALTPPLPTALSAPVSSAPCPSLVSPFTAPVSMLPRTLSEPLPSPASFGGRLQLLLPPLQTPGPSTPPAAPAPRTAPASGSHAATPQPAAGPEPMEGAPEAEEGPSALLERVAAELRRCCVERAEGSPRRSPGPDPFDFLPHGDGGLLAFGGLDDCSTVESLLGDAPLRRGPLAPPEPGASPRDGAHTPRRPDPIDFERIFSFDADASTMD